MQFVIGSAGSQANNSWWGMQDSNLRSHEAADLQSAPFATRDTPPAAMALAVHRQTAALGPTGPWAPQGRGTRLAGCAAGAFMGEPALQSQPEGREFSVFRLPNSKFIAPQIARIRH